jgi:hypothetical protein
VPLFRNRKHVLIDKDVIAVATVELAVVYTALSIIYLVENLLQNRPLFD